MNRLYIFFLSFLLACNSTDEKVWNLKSPDGEINSMIELNIDGNLSYSVFSNESDASSYVIEESPLGVEREDQLFDSLQFLSSSEEILVDEEYVRKTGKRKVNRNHYKEITLHFLNSKNNKIDLVFRAYNDGVAFRYVFPEKDHEKYRIVKELTGFNLPDGKAWLQPYDSITAYAPAYERNFGGPFEVGAESPEESGWCFPALFQVNDKWVLLTEADLDEHYFASHMESPTDEGLYKVTHPEEEEGFGYGTPYAESTLPWELPWRVVIIGSNIGDIVESNLVSHLSDPVAIEDTSWIKPGRASWGWWSGYIDGSDDNPAKLRRFIDFAHEMGWEYSLVDAGWNSRKGLEMEELVKYADDRDVDLLLWYNAGGPINRVDAGPRDKMFEPDIRRQEMSRISKMGIKGIKVDFFSSDKQDYIKLYRDILKDAAEYKLLVNFHGSTLPRGWSRTYPNMITYESVKGAEAYIYHTDFEKYSPLHNTTLPYTRNVVGSMDYTPVAFSEQQVPHKTSYGHELALSVVFESGIQHFPDTPQMYLSQPDAITEFLKEVPSVWDETKLLSGFPGKDVLIARKNHENWYVGFINGEPFEKEIEVKFDFLDPELEYQVLIIKDGVDKQEFSVERKFITKGNMRMIESLPYGGFVMQIKKAIVK
jgi:hypothetical protein